MTRGITSLMRVFNISRLVEIEPVNGQTSGVVAVTEYLIKAMFGWARAVVVTTS